LSATLGRIMGIGVPMVVGAVLAAAYLQLGVPHAPGGELPKAVEVAVPSTTTPTTGVSGAQSSPGGESSSEAGKLIVVSPTNPVLAYESGSSSPVEINPEANSEGGDKSTPSSEPVTTTQPSSTTTTAPSSDSKQASGDSSQSSGDGATTTTTQSSDSSGGDN
ncbi:MAG: hypothetical protein M0Z47_11865, partial [Actinomycetota bacterium]|nr:hypothetical protein [Actinomycetota bacterium]